VFTQCSNCNTVFELSAEVLRAAGGQVRCGRCGEIFNAFARLAEDAGAFDTGESSYELEERADSILESVVAEQTLLASPDGEAAEDDGNYGDIEIAQLQVLDFDQDSFVDESVEDAAAEPDSYDDAALEFTLPPGELDRIFVESSVGIMPPFQPPPESVELDLNPALQEFAAAEVPPHPEALHLDALHLDASRLKPDEQLPDIEVISDDRSLDDRPVAVRPLLSPVVELSAAPAIPAGSFALWLGAAVAASLLLIAQAVHHNREVLTAHGPLAPMFRSLYERLGAPVGGAPNLAAFQLRQWGVTGEATADPTLRVRASILNTTSQSQPFPLLRVTLANRYGTRIGSRDFAPDEYLGKPVARLLAPGEQVDAVLNILDPGKDAEGFEIDVCLPGSGKKMICANDAAPPQARQ
jgi:predicted Zn finger-like uncharacterized protein